MLHPTDVQIVLLTLSTTVPDLFLPCSVTHRVVGNPVSPLRCVCFPLFSGFVGREAA